MSEASFQFSLLVSKRAVRRTGAGLCVVVVVNRFSSVLFSLSYSSSIVGADLFSSSYLVSSIVLSLSVVFFFYLFSVVVTRAFLWWNIVFFFQGIFFVRRLPCCEDT